MRSPRKNVGEYSHLVCSRGKQVRGDYVVRYGDSLRDEVLNTNRTAAAVIVSSVVCTSLHNGCDTNSVGKSPNSLG